MPIDLEKLWRRKQGGRKAKAYGQVFERIFENHCRTRGIVATRFPEGCRRVGPNTLIQVRTPWDWIVTQNGRTAFIDTKTTEGKSFSHSAILPHQVSEMFRHELEGAIAGYVIWLRQIDRVIFIQSSELLRLMKLHGSVTDKHPEAVDLGCVDGDGGMKILNLFQARPK